MRALIALSLLVGSIGSPAPVAAQRCEEEPEPRSEIRSVARRHYQRGVRASTAGRWEEAREAFQQAHDVVPFTPIIYNLASSQEQTGQLVQAAESFRRFLRRCQAARMGDLQRDAEQLLAQLEERLAFVTLDIDGYDPATDEVLLDGEPLVGAVLGEALPVNPGQHEVRVMRRDVGEVAVGGFRVEEGATWTLELGADDGEAEVTEATAESTVAPPVASGGGFDATPAWVIFGAGLAVAAGGAVMLGVGQAEASAVENAEPGTPWTEVRDQAELADILRNTGWVVLGVGVAGAVIGLSWALVGGGESSGGTSIRVGPTRVAVTGRF